jgi:signal peptidase I
MALPPPAARVARQRVDAAMSEMYSRDGPENPDDDAWGTPLEPHARPPAPRRRSLFTRRLSWRGVFLVVAAVAALRLWVLESVIVDGQSMANTLQPDEWVLVLKPLRPHRLSVVTLIDPQEGVTVIKRVVGMPGDTISIEPVDPERMNPEGSRLYINGVPQDEPYATSSLPETLRPTVVPEGYYFVLGDNRDDSVDSRRYGPVPAKDLRGNALMVVYPFSHMRIVPDVAEPEPGMQAAR